ncbi:MAG TPA: helix-turn-helix domain-containing protein [Candidatus Limnocylindria bacterium]|nr:helix-turn-helix domain-containing protein [Candidatus Limnocylindria bacterium]
MTKAAQIIELHQQGGRTPTEIATIVGSTRRTVNSTIYRWRQRGCLDAKPRGRPPVNQELETSRAQDRIQRDIAAGKRCKRCWLLTPCDHTP